MMVYDKISGAKKKQFAVLVDPDKHQPSELAKLASVLQHAGADFIFIGGSLLTRDLFEHSIKIIKDHCERPLVIFPGGSMQVSAEADAILFLSLISGRNPDLLIGRQVESAGLIRDIGLEVIPTGYLLIDGGRPTSVSYMSNTLPIPADKPDIAAATALAGEMLGLKVMYLDAGSGALHPVSFAMIERVRASITSPLIVGGGIRDAEAARRAFAAGADLVVVGNSLEKDPGMAFEIAEAAMLS
jgi:phosphoglycerol geranylgeranyltransferase